MVFKVPHGSREEKKITQRCYFDVELFWLNLCIHTEVVYWCKTWVVVFIKGALIPSLQDEIQRGAEQLSLTSKFILVYLLSVKKFSHKSA